jgi:ABC-2 type transport system ATP-binding protein
MDPRGAPTRDLFRTLAKTGTTIFSRRTHQRVAEEICHRIGIIQKGELIACGTMAELHQQATGNHGNLESVFLELTRDQEHNLAVTA